MRPTSETAEIRGYLRFARACEYSFVSVLDEKETAHENVSQIHLMIS